MRKIIMILIMSLLLISCQTEEINEKIPSSEDLVTSQQNNEENNVAEPLVQETKLKELQRIQVVVDALKIRQEATTDSEQVGTVVRRQVK